LSVVPKTLPETARARAGVLPGPSIEPAAIGLAGYPEFFVWTIDGGSATFAPE
jgi:hypothetical protein